jgi:hypothetical protein
VTSGNWPGVRDADVRRDKVGLVERDEGVEALEKQDDPCRDKGKPGQVRLERCFVGEIITRHVLSLQRFHPTDVSVIDAHPDKERALDECVLPPSRNVPSDGTKGGDLVSH